MSNDELIKQIAADVKAIHSKVNSIEDRVGLMQEQLDRIERGQKKLAGDVFSHEIEIQGLKDRTKIKLVKENNI